MPYIECTALTIV